MTKSENIFLFVPNIIGKYLISRYFPCEIITLTMLRHVEPFLYLYVIRSKTGQVSMPAKI